jgi:hypothetical protein
MGAQTPGHKRPFLSILSIGSMHLIEIGSAVEATQRYSPAAIPVMRMPLPLTL